MKYIASYSIRLVRDASIKSESKEADSPEKAAAILRAFIGETAKEHCVSMMLDAHSKVIGLNLISIGTLTASLIHPREVFQPALLMSAASLIVCHNHPSGNPKPSPEDCAITKQLKQAGEILGIPLVDHIVLGEVEQDGYFSFKERGLL